MYNAVVYQIMFRKFLFALFHTLMMLPASYMFVTVGRHYVECK